MLRILYFADIKTQNSDATKALDDNFIVSFIHDIKILYALDNIDEYNFFCVQEYDDKIFLNQILNFLLDKKSADQSIILLSNNIDEGVLTIPDWKSKVLRIKNDETYLSNSIQFIESLLNIKKKKKKIYEVTSDYCQKVVIHKVGQIILINNIDIGVTNTEYLVLEYLIMNKGRNISAVEAEEKIFNNKYFYNSDNYRAHIYKIRKRIKKVLVKPQSDPIKRSRYGGYVFL